VSNSYGNAGSGEWWKGRVCSGAPVSIEGLSAVSPPFAGITAQGRMLSHCDSKWGSWATEGILGMAYPSLITEGEPFKPLFDSVLEHNSGMANIFSHQFCSWAASHTMIDNTVSAGAGGTLVLGGIDHTLYTGAIQWTAITQESNYCVSLKDVTYSGASPAVPSGGSYGGGFYDDGWDGGSCSTFIDSGANGIFLDQTYSMLVDRLKIGGSTTVCSQSERDALPDLIITLGGGVKLTIPPSKYYTYRRKGCWSLAVYANPGQTMSVIGIPMMEQYYTIYDRANSRIGFATNAGC